MADFSKLPGFMAVFRGSLSGVISFIQDGGNVNEPESHNSTTMLIQAAFNGNTPIAKFLITAGANVNHKDKYNQTALMYAALAGRGAMVKLLLENGADHTVVSANNSTALSIALQHKKLGVVEIMQYFIRQKEFADKNGEEAPEVTTLQPESELKLRILVDIVEYTDIKDFVEKYVHKDHNFKLKVLSIMKVLYDHQKYTAVSSALLQPNRSARKFYGNSVKAINSIIQSGFSLSALVSAKKLGKFGSGVYFYSDSSDAANNCGSDQYLLVCDVAIGKYWTVNSSMSHMTLTELKDTGYDSIYAQRGSLETGGVEHDEFVVYHPDQAVPLYLVEFEKIAIQDIPSVPPTPEKPQQTQPQQTQPLSQSQTQIQTNTQTQTHTQTQTQTQPQSQPPQPQPYPSPGTQPVQQAKPQSQSQPQSQPPQPQSQTQLQTNTQPQTQSQTEEPELTPAQVELLMKLIHERLREVEQQQQTAMEIEKPNNSS